MSLESAIGALMSLDRSVRSTARDGSGSKRGERDPICDAVSIEVVRDAAVLLPRVLCAGRVRPEGALAEVMHD
jgi:hypothetical protein